MPYSYRSPQSSAKFTNGWRNNSPAPYVCMECRRTSSQINIYRNLQQQKSRVLTIKNTDIYKAVWTSQYIPIICQINKENTANLTIELDGDTDTWLVSRFLWKQSYSNLTSPFVLDEPCWIQYVSSIMNGCSAKRIRTRELISKMV
jgi:hypothetical protein